MHIHRNTQKKDSRSLSAVQYDIPPIAEPALKSQISDAFPSVGVMPNKWSTWSETVRVLTARKNLAFTLRRPPARRTCAYFATSTTSHRLQTGCAGSFRLGPS